MRNGSSRLATLFIAVIVGILPALVLSPASVDAAGVVGDGTPGSCNQAALEAALASSGTVTFNCGGPATILINGGIQISADTSIDGAEEITLDGDEEGRIFEIDPGITVELTGLGFVNGDPGAGEEGGAILNNGADLTIANSLFLANFAEGSAGALAHYGGNLTISNTGFIENFTNGSGAGIVADGAGAVTITDSLFDGNEADGFGGALFLASDGGTRIERTEFVENLAAQGGGIMVFGGGTVEITDSTIRQNFAPGLAGSGVFADGGGISISTADVEITRSTLSENFALGRGGGIFRAGSSDLTIRQSTISGNSAAVIAGGDPFAGGGVFNNFGGATSGSTMIIDSTIVNNAAGPARVGAGIVSRGEMSIENSIVANNVIVGSGITDNCFIDTTEINPPGEITSNGHNLSDDDSCPFTSVGDLTETNPLLGPLADNGGPTQTHLPDLDSPVLGGGPNSCGATDQRGIARPQGVRCDIGAVEIALQADICVNRYNGDLRVPRRSCASTELGYYFIEQGPMNACINRYNGDARYSRTGRCASTETALVIAGDGSQSICVNRYNGDVRIPRVAGRCASTEVERMI